MTESSYIKFQSDKFKKHLKNTSYHVGMKIISRVIVFSICKADDQSIDNSNCVSFHIGDDSDVCRTDAVRNEHDTNRLNRHITYDHVQKPKHTKNWSNFCCVDKVCQHYYCQYPIKVICLLISLHNRKAFANYNSLNLLYHVLKLHWQKHFLIYCVHLCS